MAVETLPVFATYTGTGSLASYPVPFYFVANSQVRVTVDGVLKTIGDDYTLSGARNPSGGDVSANFPLAAAVLIERVTTITQDVDTQNNETILADVLDDEFDKLTMIAQEADERLDRAVVSLRGETPQTLPALSLRAGKVLAFDGAGTLFAAPYSTVDIAISVAAAAAYATAAAGSATSAGNSAVASSGYAANALSYANAAAASASNAAAAVASSSGGYYPNVATANVPRGLVPANDPLGRPSSVGAITPGSGGTNGTFALGFSGGNFTTNPTGTFTVAGGVLTAVAITGPGLYIGASPTVPTVSFAASAGLTGAAVALTAQFLIAAGVGYWAQDATGSEFDRYQNVGGVATPASPAVAALPTTAGLNAAMNALSIITTSAIKAALGPGETLKLHLSAQGVKTFSSSSNVLTVTSNEGSALVFNANNQSFLFTGAGKYVTYDGVGLLFPRTAGLQYSGVIATAFTNAAIYWTQRFYTPDFTLATSRTAALATVAGAPATYPQGTVIAVTGGSNVATPTPRDVYDTTDCGYEYASSDNGIYDVDFGNVFVQTAAIGGSAASWSAYDSTNANKIITFTTEVNGQGVVKVWDTVLVSIVTLRVPVEKLRLTGSLNTFGLVFSRGFIELWFNGTMVCSVQATVALTNIDTWRINGRVRNNNVNTPVDGLHQEIRDFIVIQGP